MDTVCSSVRIEIRAHQVVENLISNNSNHVEGLARCDRVNDDVAMNSDEMLRVQDAVFILASRVHDLRSKVLAFVLDGAAECILDRRVVALHKDPVDKADSKG